MLLHEVAMLLLVGLSSVSHANSFLDLVPAYIKEDEEIRAAVCGRANRIVVADIATVVPKVATAYQKTLSTPPQHQRPAQYSEVHIDVVRSIFAGAPHVPELDFIAPGGPNFSVSGLSVTFVPGQRWVFAFRHPDNDWTRLPLMALKYEIDHAQPLPTSAILNDAYQEYCSSSSARPRGRAEDE